MADYWPAEGEHVQATLRGKAIRVSESIFDLGLTTIDRLRDDFVSVEKVSPPLPTTPGSVIRAKSNRHRYMRTDHGQWVSTYGVTFNDDAFSDIEVIHDAGADK